ncbi:MAG: T9SS type A sorting domain-containing protein [Crocinitomicaceae bacterium]|nr:T9SS type A sorting domain-containing protein [Crocinitomicaceae bacterium]
MNTLLPGLCLLISCISYSQIEDSVVLGAGYTNESYYSLENGEIANVDNNNWDLGFDLSGFGATIKLNRRQSIMWVYPGITSDWATLDTTGMNSWATYTDTYNSWDEGAFNNCADTTDASDVGWGLYNSVTHIIEGERIFVMELSNGDYKKIYFEQLAAGTYSFKYANLDNTGEVNETVVKSNYPDKNFVYYSVLTESIVDREPVSAVWDMVFTNVVLELAPYYFGGVTNVLHNKGISVSEISGVPTTSATYGAFEDPINTIGSDWKTFDMGLMQYQIEDSLTYFVQTASGDVWKLFFTGFNGSTDGKIYFTKEKVAFANVAQENPIDMKLYPNPASHLCTIQTKGDPITSIKLFNMNGQLVYSQTYNAEMGNIEIPTSSFQEGIYLLNVVNTQNELSTYKLIVKH